METTIKKTPSITHESAFTVMSMDTLKAFVPSAFSEGAKYHVTGHYIKYPTPAILEVLKTYGWEVFTGYEVKAKLKKNQGFQKHFIRLRNPKMFIGTHKHVTVIPELLVVNSYDGRCKIKIFLILYRVICDNGLVVGIQGQETISVAHRGDDNSTWSKTEIFDKINNNVSNTIRLMEVMEKTTLTRAAQLKYARESLRSRFPYTYTLKKYDDLLMPQRKEDEGSSLWVVYNRVQEKIIKGGWIGAGGKTIKPLTNPDRALLVNDRLFNITENFIQA